MTELWPISHCWITSFQSLLRVFDLSTMTFVVQQTSAGLYLVVRWTLNGVSFRCLVNIVCNVNVCKWRSSNIKMKHQRTYFIRFQWILLRCSLNTWQTLNGVGNLCKYLPNICRQRLQSLKMKHLETLRGKLAGCLDVRWTFDDVLFWYLVNVVCKRLLNVHGNICWTSAKHIMVFCSDVHRTLSATIL